MKHLIEQVISGVSYCQKSYPFLLAHVYGKVGRSHGWVVSISTICMIFTMYDDDPLCLLLLLLLSPSIYLCNAIMLMMTLYQHHVLLLPACFFLHRWTYTIKHTTTHSYLAVDINSIVEMLLPSMNHEKHIYTGAPSWVFGDVKFGSTLYILLIQLANWLSCYLLTHRSEINF